MRKIVFFLIMALIVNAANAEEVDCVANKVGAQAAAKEAASNNNTVKALTVGAGATAGCGVLLGLTGWFDLGLSAAICFAAGAGAVALTPKNSEGKAAEEAYKEYLDPRCREK